MLSDKKFMILISVLLCGIAIRFGIGATSMLIVGILFVIFVTLMFGWFLMILIDLIQYRSIREALRHNSFSSYVREAIQELEE